MQIRGRPLISSRDTCPRGQLSSKHSRSIAHRATLSLTLSSFLLPFRPSNTRRSNEFRLSGEQRPAMYAFAFPRGAYCPAFATIFRDCWIVKRRDSRQCVVLPRSFNVWRVGLRQRGRPQELVIVDEFNASRRPTANGSEFKRRRLSRVRIIHLASDGCPAGNAEDIGPRSHRCGLYRRKLRVFLGLSRISAGPCGHFNGSRGLTVIADRRHRSNRVFGTLATRDTDFVDVATNQSQYGNSSSRNGAMYFRGM